MTATLLQGTLTLTDAEGARREKQWEPRAVEVSHFVRYAWPVVEPAHAFAPNWHMDAIADHLQAVAESQIKRLLINIPPGHAKSLIVSVLWLAWMWIWNREGAQWRGLFASYAEALAMRDSVRCRKLMRSQWYRET